MDNPFKCRELPAAPSIEPDFARLIPADWEGSDELSCVISVRKYFVV